MQLITEFLTESSLQRKTEEQIRDLLKTVDLSTLFVILLSFEDYSSSFFDDSTETLHKIVKKADTKAIEILRSIIHSIIASNFPHSSMHIHIQQLSEDPSSTLASLKAIRNETTVAGYFRSILLADAYSMGRSVTPSEETTLFYMTIAADIAQKVTLNSGLMLAFKVLRSVSKTTPDTFFHSKSLYYRFKKLEIAQKKYDFNKPKLDLLAELRNDCKSILKYLSDDINYLDRNYLKFSIQKSILEDYQKFFTEHFANLSLLLYQKDLSRQFPNPNTINLRSQLNLLEVDKPLFKNFTHDATDFLNLLEQAGDFEYGNKEYYWARLWYELLNSLKSSPKTLLKLAKMAANGQHSKVNQPGYITQPDFLQASAYLSKAIDEAIQARDFQTVTDILRFYKTIEANLSPDVKVGLVDKVKTAEIFISKSASLPETEQLKLELQKAKEDLAKANAKIATYESKGKGFSEFLHREPENLSAGPKP